MATNYSYICWGGRTGKSVTVNASTDYVTLTNHGLRNGKGVAFTSGTLPAVSGTALALNTTYYVKSIASSTFELYYDVALTSKINFTSTGSSLILKGAHFLALPNPSRYGSPWNERIYDGLISFRTARESVTSPSDYEVCEIGEAFDDYMSDQLQLNFGAAATLVTTMVNGVRSEAFHNGVVGAGFIARRDEGYGYRGLYLAGYNSTVDGFTIQANNVSTYGLLAIQLARPNCIASRMIAIGSGVLRGKGVTIVTGFTHAINCLVTGFGTGLEAPQYQYGVMFKNNIATKNTTGFGVNTAGQNYGLYLNNIAVGNTTNWSASGSMFERAAYNAGESGDTPWVTSTNPSITMATTDFADFTNDNFRPAARTSPQVEAGMYLYGAEFDLADNVRPSYVGVDYGSTITAGAFVTGLAYTIATVGTTDFTLIGASANTVGLTFKATGAGSGTGTAVLTAVFDIGCYEFDQGYGPWPATTTVTFLGVNAGSEIRVYDASANELAGVESSAANPSLSWNLTGGDVRVVIVHPNYKIKEFSYTPEAGDASLPVQQELDKWYSNP